MSRDLPFKALDTQDTTKLLATVHEQRVEILFKFDNSTVFKARAEAKGWGQSILLPVPSRLDTTRKDQIVAGNFTLGSDIFFFKAKIRIQKTHLHLEILDSIQQLVRRAIARYRIPEGMTINMYTKRIGENLIFLRGDVLDLSSKGCQIRMTAADATIKAEQVLIGDLRFANRKAIGFEGSIRHVKKSAKDRFECTFGLQFTSVEDEARLEQWITDIQRELFRIMT